MTWREIWQSISTRNKYDGSELTWPEVNRVFEETPGATEAQVAAKLGQPVEDVSRMISDWYDDITSELCYRRKALRRFEAEVERGLRRYGLIADKAQEDGDHCDPIAKR